MLRTVLAGVASACCLAALAGQTQAQSVAVFSQARDDETARPLTPQEQEPDASASRRAAEVCSRLPIHLREIGADRHGVHQVVSRVHASEREVQRRLIEAVTLDDLCR